MPSLSRAAKTAKNADVIDAALALAHDRIAARLPGVEPRRRRGRRRALVIGGAAAVVAGVAFLRRDKVAGLLRGGGEPPSPAEPAPPGPSNYDVAGPVANTSTPVPAPAPAMPPGLDEDAEEAAAAAEAANIGGPVSDYAGLTGDTAAGDADRPLMEAGEGDAEGQEQTEAELAAAAEPTAPGISDQERQIEDAIEAAGNPTTPEHVEPLTGGGISGRGLDPDAPARPADGPAPPDVPETGDAGDRPASSPGSASP